MTGKEALIYVSKGLSALAFEEGKWKISERDNEALQVLRKIVQKYDKYKKIFEILKDNCHISNYVVDGVNSGKKITFDVIREWYDKEEYELLEELMKDE